MVGVIGHCTLAQITLEPKWLALGTLVVCQSFAALSQHGLDPLLLPIIQLHWLLRNISICIDT